MTKIQERVAKNMAVPVILQLLRPYKASDMTYAINNNVNLAKELQNDGTYLGQIQLLTRGVPFISAVASNIKKKKWILWFVNGPMKKKRPDLYNQIIYNPKGEKYILRQIRKLVDVVFA